MSVLRARAAAAAGTEAIPARKSAFSKRLNTPPLGSRMTRVRFALVLIAPLLLGRCSSGTADLAPLEWQKVPGGGPRGAVLGPGPVGNFDEVGNFTISAFKDGEVYKLYYGGADTAKVDPNCGGINGVHWRIGLATSSDGLNWTRVPGPAAKGAILDNGDSSHFDSFLTYRPYV